jgi:hypothetical protein
MSAAAPRYARPFVAVFLAALVVCALVPVNLWPFSNWELFSRLRTGEQIGWFAVAVDGAGRMHDYPLARDPNCTAWLRDSTARYGPGTRVVQIYRVEWELSGRHGKRGAPHRVTLAGVCGAKGGARATS